MLMIHGCAGTAFNWWPQSAACNNCRGMPEQMSHTIQALARGYAGGRCGCCWVAAVAPSAATAVEPQLLLAL